MTQRIIEPVLRAGAGNTLKDELPKLGKPRDAFAPLEAIGRTLAGVAPWLELGPGDDAEGKLRARYIELAVKTLENAVDPDSPGHLDFAEGKQSLVDAAFVAQALLRAPNQLWANLDAEAQANMIRELKATRAIEPYPSNWLLFSAMVEAALLEFTGECEMGPIEHAVNRHLEWYVGDGTYGDGPEWHWDYYNSFVIQPMLVEVLEVCARHDQELGQHLPRVKARSQRYAAVLERMISPEGTYPVIGRSSAYRFGALQSLSMAALRHELVEPATPGGVRNALTAVIHRMIEAPGTFDEQGWLRIGVVGHQPGMAEEYINHGSIYLCTFGLMQLGLPADDPFWTVPAEPWTQRRIWQGENLSADHAYHEPRSK